MSKETLEFLGKVVTIFSVVLGALSLIIGIIALWLTLTADYKLTQSTDAAFSASNSADDAVKLAESNSGLIVEEDEKTRTTIKEGADKTIEAVVETKEAVVANKEAVVANREAVLATKEAVVEEGEKTRVVINEGTENTVTVLKEIVSILKGNNPVGDKQQNETVDPTNYLEIPESGDNKREATFLFNDGALVLSPPENSNVYEILAAFSSEIDKLPSQNNSDLIIVPGNFDKSHVQKFKSVAEVFHNAEIEAVPIREDSKAILPLWKIISEAASRKGESQAALNAEGETIENVIEISYGSPLTVVFPR